MGDFGLGLLSGGLGIAGQAISANMYRQGQEGMQAAQMAFQERMANTVYQRGVKDLQAAGLNPMLAYMNSAAPSPGGSMGSTQATDMGGALQRGLQTALDSKRLENETQMADANVKQASSNATLNLARAHTETFNAATAEQEGWRKAMLNDVLKQQQKAMFKAAENDAAQEDYRAKFMQTDQWQKRLDNWLGTANSAVDLLKPGSHGAKPQSYKDEYYDAGGEFRGQRSRTYTGE